MTLGTGDHSRTVAGAWRRLRRTSPVSDAPQPCGPASLAASITVQPSHDVCALVHAPRHSDCGRLDLCHVSDARLVIARSHDRELSVVCCAGIERSWRACWTAVRLGALREGKFGAANGSVRAAASPRWRCSAFVSNIFRTGRDINVWSSQSCSPRPAFTRVRTCIQMKQGFVFQWWKNLRCEERRASGAATGFVELEFATTCRKGKHKYRGQVDGYSYPPAGAGVAQSAREFEARC